MTIQSISIVITTFNSAQFVASAVQSVRDQTFANIDLLAVDNNSTDSTIEMLCELAVPFVTESIQGAGAARNRGLQEVNTEAVLFLDSDDSLQPLAIAKLAAFLDQTEADAVYGRIQNKQLPSTAAVNTKRSIDCSVNTSQMAPLSSSTLIRRSTFTKYGVLDHDNFSWPRWVVRARDSGARLEGLNEEVAFRGVHGGNVSLQENSMAEFFQIIRARTSHGGKKQ